MFGWCWGLDFSFVFGPRVLSRAPDKGGRHLKDGVLKEFGDAALVDTAVKCILCTTTQFLQSRYEAIKLPPDHFFFSWRFSDIPYQP